MQQENTRRGFTQAENVVIKQNIIPEFISGSSTQVVTQVLGKLRALKTLKRVQGLSHFTITHGFTLIELLIVVLIIGILAAVALPQYQKAVRKARVAEAKAILKQLTDAQDVYLLSHSELPDDYTTIDEWNKVLDINFPENTKNWAFGGIDCSNENGKIGCSNQARPLWENYSYAIWYDSPNYAGNFANHFSCTDDENICTDLGGILASGTNNIYILP